LNVWVYSQKWAFVPSILLWVNERIITKSLIEQPYERLTPKPEVSRLQSAVPIFQFDYLGLTGGRIQASNRAAVFHPSGLNSPTRSGGF